MIKTTKLTRASFLVSLFFSLVITSRTCPIFLSLISMSAGIFLSVIFFSTNTKYTLLSLINFIVIMIIMDNSVTGLIELVSNLIIGLISIFVTKNKKSNVKLDILIGTILSAATLFFFDYITYIFTGHTIFLDIISDTSNNILLLKFIIWGVCVFIGYSIFYYVYAASIFICCKLKLNSSLKNKYNAIFKNKKEL